MKKLWNSVNLLRWSLKQDTIGAIADYAGCKFTPMEFETELTKAIAKSGAKCKFTPMEFETLLAPLEAKAKLGVNLLRWSLKPNFKTPLFLKNWCVNLLRWSLKLVFGDYPIKLFECKFTPMEFETQVWCREYSCHPRVNLLQWSLKLAGA